MGDRTDRVKKCMYQHTFFHPVRPITHVYPRVRVQYRRPTAPVARLAPLRIPARPKTIGQISGSQEGPGRFLSQLALTVAPGYNEPRYNEFLAIRNSDSRPR